MLKNKLEKSLIRKNNNFLTRTSAVSTDKWYLTERLL